MAEGVADVAAGLGFSARPTETVQPVNASALATATPITLSFIAHLYRSVAGRCRATRSHIDVIGAGHELGRSPASPAATWRVRYAYPSPDVSLCIDIIWSPPSVARRVCPRPGPSASTCRGAGRRATRKATVRVTDSRSDDGARAMRLVIGFVIGLVIGLVVIAPAGREGSRLSTANPGDARPAPTRSGPLGRRDQGLVTFEIGDSTTSKRGTRGTIAHMDERESLIERRILGVALDRMRDEPVVLLEGPRTVGKSTALRALARRTGGEILDLDNLATRDAVLKDPATIIAGSRLTCIDEYQRAPSVLDAIKAELNRSSRPGQFVLTGSARHESLPTAAQALSGRLHRMTVYPLAQSEIEGTAPDILARLFTKPDQMAQGRASQTTREDYIGRITRR